MKEYFVARTKLEGKIQATLAYWKGLTESQCQCEKLETQKILQVEGSVPCVYYLRRGSARIHAIDVYDFVYNEFEKGREIEVEEIDTEVLVGLGEKLEKAISDHKKRLKEYAQRMLETLK